MVVNPVWLLVLAIALLATPASADVLEIGDDGRVAVMTIDHPTLAPNAILAALIQKAAYDNGVSPQLLEALVWQESHNHADAISTKGAIGLAQLMPSTAKMLGVNPHDPAANLEGGARYLRQQLDRFGDLELALAAYNAGPERIVAAGGVPAISETRNYVDAVIARIAVSP